MKAIPLYQPWAQLVAMGWKRVETRSWPAPIAIVGERVAIHATKTGLTKGDERDVLAGDHFREAFSQLYPDLAGPDGDLDVWTLQERLPRGAVVALARVVRTTQITVETAETLRLRHPAEHAFGLYTPGRWAWVLADIQALPEPIPAKGHQGIFEIPDEDLGIYPAQLTIDEVAA